MSDDHLHRIEALFHQALSYAPAARAAFIKEACAEDKALCREVEALLQYENLTDSFLENQALVAAAHLDSDVLQETQTLLTGQQIGVYKILSPLGKGGMGEVYLALDTRLQRKVAIKLLPARFTTDAERVRRFAQEARAASALNHPNILTIHEIGEVEDTHYIVTEYVAGETLRQRMASAPHKQVQLTESLTIIAQISEALAAAHEAGIVHRDIKPENVMVRPDGYVKVLDFGLAKLTEPTSAVIEPQAKTVASLTEAGVVMGTPRYMSPEQARGEKVDARTDVFSLGVMLYELIAGNAPFVGATSSEVIAAILRDEPPSLAACALEVPLELERIVRQVLRKDRATRYQTAKELFVDLQQLKKRLEFETEVRRELGFSPVGGLPLVQAAAQSSNAEMRIFKKEPQNSIAVLPFANLSPEAENEYFCDGLAEELLNALAKIDDLKVAARTSAFSFKGKNTTISEIGDALHVKTLLEGSVRKSGDNLRITVQLVNAADGYHLWSERYDREMQDIFNVQDEITLAVVDALKVKLLGSEKAAVLRHYTNNTEAYLFYLKGMYYRWKLVPEEFGKCLKYFQQAVDADPSFALGYFGLASYYGYGSAWGLLPLPPNEGWQKAEAAITKTLELDATLPEVKLTMAAFRLVNHREWEAAGKAIEYAANLNSEFPEIHHLYSFYLVAVGQFDKAIAEAQRALELDPLSLNYSRFLGICFYYSRRYDAAVAQFREALELEPHDLSVHEILGDVLVQKGMFGEAVAEWQRAMTFAGDNELATILISAYAEDNFTAAAHAVARKKVERMSERRGKGEYVPAIYFAREYIKLDEEEMAFQWLGQACEERNVYALLINSDPFYDSLRGNSHFEDLWRSIGWQTNSKAQSKFKSKADENATLVLEAAQQAAPTNAKMPPDNPTQNSSAEYVVGAIKRHKSLALWMLIALLIGTTGLGAYFLWGGKPVLVTGTKKSLAVLPFVNASQDANAEYLSDGITESIINNLSQLTGLKVMSRNSAFRFKTNQSDTRNIAAQLGVQALVTGDIQQVGDKLVINVRLLDASDDSQIWGHQYVKISPDIIATQNEIAQAVAQNLRVQLSTSEQQQLSKKYTENAEAYQLYLRGRFHVFKLTPPEVQTGISYFQQAIAIDPNYALAYAGISDAYRSLALGVELLPTEFLPKSKAAAQKAIELDEALSEGHAALGMAIFWVEWDWAAAENQYKRALELNPNSAIAHLFYAHLLSNTGRHAEALTEVKLARELDPLFPFGNALEGQFLLHAGRTDEALAHLQKTFELAPNFWMPHIFAASAYIEKGMYAEAIAEAHKGGELSATQTNSEALDGYALAKLGRREEARAKLNELLQRSTTRFVPPYHLALIYNGLGEKDEAFAWLERGIQQRDPKMTFLKVEPKWNNLRSDPRFQALLRRVGFTL